MKRHSLKLHTTMMLWLVALFAIAMVANYFWVTQSARSQTIEELCEEGRALTQETYAVWDFMSANQKRLESVAYTEDGVYQGLHCAIAGRSIAKIFTLESNTIMRFVQFEPRNAEDVPDAFETEALNAFIADPTLQEYYEISSYEDMDVFRYAAPMKIVETCLECHGSPKGSIDITGNVREGWTLDDIGGAVSIVIPLELYEEAENDTIFRSLAFLTALLLVVVIVVYLVLRGVVLKPLRVLQSGVTRIQKGDRGVELKSDFNAQELSSLTSSFNEMARELNALYNNLESQVEDRTEQLTKANAILKRQQEELAEVNETLVKENRYKTDFLNLISHELRTPLTSIIAFSDLLNSQREAENDTEADIRREIEANSRVLLLMINDILEMSRLDSGRITFSPELVDVGDLAELVIPIVRPLSVRNKVSLNCEIAPDVPLIKCDFEKMRRVLENLLGNALKFTPSGGNVGLRVAYCRDIDSVSFEVWDTGIGIAEEDQERIFQRFVQADSSASRKYNGTGLGLSLALEYVELHGGTITLKSEVGKGSAFTVLIPVNNGDNDVEQGAL